MSSVAVNALVHIFVYTHLQCWVGNSSRRSHTLGMLSPEIQDGSCCHECSTSLSHCWQVGREQPEEKIVSSCGAEESRLKGQMRRPERLVYIQTVTSETKFTRRAGPLCAFLRFFSRGFQVLMPLKYLRWKTVQKADNLCFLGERKLVWGKQE